MMEVLSILVLCLGLALCFGAQYKIRHQKKIDQETEEKNQKILKEYNELLKKQEDLIYKINILTEQEQTETNKLKDLNEITSDLNKSAAAAFEQYCLALEESYKSKEEEFENNIELLDNSYMMAQDSWIEKQNVVLSDLKKMSQTRAAVMEAQLREEQIKAEKEFYTLQIPTLDLKDAKTLREIEPKLNNPRVLRMLIWQNFYREPMNSLCSRILGTGVKTGIYKITNQNNGICYIGQAVDIADRWKKHAKCGLGIDAPASNQLYNAMQKDGLENFSWELLEECLAAQLNEKEKFFIELYQSKEYGYNQTGGNR